MTDIDNLPVFERKILLEKLIDIKKKEKEAQEGNEGRQSLLRDPLPGEMHGLSDVEKLGRPEYRKRLNSERPKQTMSREELRKKADAVFSARKDKQKK